VNGDIRLAKVSLILKKDMMKRFLGSENLFTGNRSVSPGSFLIASAALNDSPFDKAVIFVLQNNPQGTFGVILNRPADSQLTNSWRAATGLNFASTSLVNGGPIGGPVLALHPQRSIAEVEICSGVCLSIDSQAIKFLSEQNDFPYRIILGIAGWQPGQLENEIEQGWWYQLKADPIHIFDDPFSMWQSFIRNFGLRTLSDWFGERVIPESPLLN
jgi:putative transcriptional regulator